jgi:hypothetical protein
MHEPVDQVTRRREFESQHPDIGIQVEREGFISTWTASQDGEVIATAYDLSDLLDALKKRVTA